MERRHVCTCTAKYPKRLETLGLMGALRILHFGSLQAPDTAVQEHILALYGPARTPVLPYCMYCTSIQLCGLPVSSDPVALNAPAPGQRSSNHLLVPTTSTYQFTLDRIAQRDKPR